jgi:hypothetical protein
MYDFTVIKAAEVDLQRVCDEAAGQDAILLTSKGEQALLLLRQDWLSKWAYEENRCVAGGHLCPTWGTYVVNVYEVRDGVNFLASTGLGHKLPKGWRALSVSKEHIAAAVREVKAALNYAPRRRVTVSYISKEGEARA